MKKATSFPWLIRIFMISLVSVIVLMASSSGAWAQGVSFKQVAFEGVFVADLNETIFLDSLEWRWRLR